MTEQEKEIFYRKIGDKIKAIRETAGINQSKFAEALELSRTSIVNIEKGRQRPSLHLLVEISRVFDCTLNDLIPELNNHSSEAEIDSDDKFKKEFENLNERTRTYVTSFLKKIK